MKRTLPAHKRLHAEWGKNLRSARANEGLTQTALAELVGVNQNSISRFEQGNPAPDDAMKLRLCLALGYQVEDLFGWPFGILDVAANEAS